MVSLLIETNFFLTKLSLAGKIFQDFKARVFQFWNWNVSSIKLSGLLGILHSGLLGILHSEFCRRLLSDPAVDFINERFLAHSYIPMAPKSIISHPASYIWKFQKWRATHASMERLGGMLACLRASLVVDVLV